MITTIYNLLDEFPIKQGANTDRIKKVITFGERLYHKDLALRAFRQQKNEQIHKKLELEEKLNETHTPKISNISTNTNNKVI